VTSVSEDGGTGRWGCWTAVGGGCRNERSRRTRPRSGDAGDHGSPVDDIAGAVQIVRVLGRSEADGPAESRWAGIGQMEGAGSRSNGLVAWCDPMQESRDHAPQPDK